MAIVLDSYSSPNSISLRVHFRAIFGNTTHIKLAQYTFKTNKIFDSYLNRVLLIIKKKVLKPYVVFKAKIVHFFGRTTIRQWSIGSRSDCNIALENLTEIKSADFYSRIILQVNVPFLARVKIRQFNHNRTSLTRFVSQT